MGAGDDAHAGPMPSRVLVADDSGVCRAKLKAICKRLYPSCSITCVNDGDEAVAAFEAALQEGIPYHAVLLDLNMVGDDDRPQLTGMLDARNGPQASARIRRSEIAAHRARSLIVVITGSTRTDRWDLAYYEGCGIDGFLQKPVSIASLRLALDELMTKMHQQVDAEQGTQRDSLSADLEEGVSFARVEAPLFGDESTAINMYIEPALMNKVSSGDSPFSAIQELTLGELDGLSSYAGMSHVMEFGTRVAVEDAAEVPVQDPEPIDPTRLSNPASNDPLGDSPLPPPKHSNRMAPRMPRRGAAPHRSGTGTHHAIPIPRAAGALHYLIVNGDSLLLMVKTAVVQSLSLEHAVTRASSTADAIEKLKTLADKAVDVVLFGPVTDDHNVPDDTRTRAAVEELRASIEEHRSAAGADPDAVVFCSVTASKHVRSDSAAMWNVDDILPFPLSRSALQTCVDQKLKHL